jgi:opacity protein-like surface antigen
MNLLDQLFRSTPVEIIYSDAEHLQCMLQFEAALAHAEARVGIMPESAARTITAKCKADLFDQKELAIGAAASGNLASGGPTSTTLKNSVGAAAQAGLNLKVMDQWSLNASVAVARVKTDMVASTGSIERKTQIDLRPVVFTVGLSYGF